jgi:hypothetical protein
LQLGGIETERNQVITWDPEIVAQAKEAVARHKMLEALGFTVLLAEEGEIVLAPPALGPNVGVFRVMSENGDDRVIWDRTDPAQVREAYSKFGDFMSRGYTAYAVGDDGRKGHRIDTFDPSLQEVLLVPATKPG